MSHTRAVGLHWAPLCVAFALCRPCAAQTPKIKLLGTSHFGGDLYLSDARTRGGLGGGIGVRLSWRDRWLIDANGGFLAGAGQVQAVRVAVGVQWPGSYCPSLTVGPRFLFGDATHFLTPQHRRSQPGPAWSFGLTLTPLRFRVDETELALGAIYFGVGSDFPGRGLGYGITPIEVGVSL